MAVVVRHVAAVIPDGADGVCRGERAIRSVMQGASQVQCLDGSSARVGSRIALDAVDARIPERVAAQSTHSSRFALMAGLDLLETAGLLRDDGTLPEELRDRTGVIFSSSFEHHEASLASVRYAARRDELDRVRRRLADVPGAAPVLDVLAEELETKDTRKVALQLLLGANVQLAELVKARGPNTYTSNACASATAALALACSTLRAGDADRVVVMACDTLLQPDADAVVESFQKLGAASTASTVCDAVRPFSEGRNGFVLGDGAVALLLERGDVVGPPSSSPTVSVLASRLANSAFHGTRLDPTHLASVVRGCVEEACGRLGLASLSTFASRAVYVSHETGTASCADVEMRALEEVFGRAALQRMAIAGTKGSTGHMMGSGMEDVVAVASLRDGVLPATRVPAVDAAFSDLCFADGRAGREYALHVSAGLGSHVAVVVYATAAR